MDAERTAFRNDPLGQLRAVHCDFPVAGVVEEDLELVHDDQDPGQRLAGDVPVAVQARRARFLEQGAAVFHLGDQFFQDAFAELLHRVECEQLDVRQGDGLIDLEFRTALEVHQIEMQLVRRVIQHRAHDERMQEGRFAGTGRACDQAVVRRTFAEGDAHQAVAVAYAYRDPEHLCGIHGEQFVLQDIAEREAFLLDRLALLRILADEALGRLAGNRCRDVDLQVIGQHLIVAVLVVHRYTVLAHLLDPLVDIVVAGVGCRGIVADKDKDAALAAVP